MGIQCVELEGFHASKTRSIFIPRLAAFTPRLAVFTLRLAALHVALTTPIGHSSQNYCDLPIGIEQRSTDNAAALVWDGHTECVALTCPRVNFVLRFPKQGASLLGVATRMQCNARRMHSVWPGQ